MGLTTIKYKQTEVGLIPEDWETKALGQLAKIIGGGTPKTNEKEYWDGNISWFTPTEVGKQKYLITSNRKITPEGLQSSSAQILPIGTILLTSRAGIGDLGILKKEAATNQGFQSLLVYGEYDNEYVYYLLSTLKPKLLSRASGSTFLEISPSNVKGIRVGIPSTLNEQKAIAQVLSDVDALIKALEKKIAKKKLIKKGVMQKLLTSKVGWEMKTIKDVADCLDYTRIPLNEAQRAKMKGSIPYCGANGIVDYVNDFTIDDDVILIAEDGGYFDEYEDRPIAYRIMGKCWVNNHAHVLKAKRLFSQGFLFHSLVHKNILGYINGGTRAKLNKAEMFKIEIHIPISKDEQNRIATILDDLEDEITVLKQKLSKYQLAKQGMMQYLLTGKIRLV
jgi:type I restriction enzyme S subunit